LSPALPNPPLRHQRGPSGSLNACSCGRVERHTQWSLFMALLEHPNQAHDDDDGVFVWLIVIALALAVLVIADRHGALILL